MEGAILGRDILDGACWFSRFCTDYCGLCFLEKIPSHWRVRQDIGGGGFYFYQILLSRARRVYIRRYLVYLNVVLAVCMAGLRHCAVARVYISASVSCGLR